MPSTQDFENELDNIFAEAKKLGVCAVWIKSSDLHDKLNGNNELPKCCNAMDNKKEKGDIIIQSPPKGQGRNLIIQYKIPR